MLSFIIGLDIVKNVVDIRDVVIQDLRIATVNLFRAR